MKKKENEYEKDVCSDNLKKFGCRRCSWFEGNWRVREDLGNMKRHVRRVCTWNWLTEALLTRDYHSSEFHYLFARIPGVNVVLPSKESTRYFYKSLYISRFAYLPPNQKSTTLLKKATMNNVQCETNSHNRWRVPRKEWKRPEGKMIFSSSDFIFRRNALSTFWKDKIRMYR